MGEIYARIRTMGSDGFRLFVYHRKVGQRIRLGEAGYLEAKRDIAPSLKGTPEVGWAFVKAAQGKGYATEAVRAALTWAMYILAKSAWPASSRPKTAPPCASQQKQAFAKRTARATRARRRSCCTANPGAWRASAPNLFRSASESTLMPGLYFDQFHVGQTFEHADPRTVTESDNVRFTA